MLRVVVVGLGPIGIGAARAVLADPGMKLVGLVDIDPAKVGKPVSELEGGPVVSKSLKEGATGGADNQTSGASFRMAMDLADWSGRGAPTRRGSRAILRVRITAICSRFGPKTNSSASPTRVRRWSEKRS